MKLVQELEFARALAEEAGQAMRSNFGFNTSAVWKADSTPLTETDTAINQLVIERVKSLFPHDGVLGEEASYQTEANRLWVVDPIDGTQPFHLGAPLSTFCLSLVTDGLPQLGLIYDPYLRRLWQAVKGEGASVNDQPLRASPVGQLNQQYILLSSRMGREEGFRKTGELFDELEAAGGKCFNFRSFANGSTYVAAGTAVAAVIGAPHAWDVAATKIIVEEAGGKVTDLDGNDRRYDSDGKGLLASNGLVHDQLLELIHA